MGMFNAAVLMLGVLLLVLGHQAEAQSRSLGMPNLAEEDIVHFYYLRSDVAYNIDVDNMTESMHGGYETHAGIGIWDVTLNVKFSVELVPKAGIGNIFFPIVDTSNTSDIEFTWMNVGEVHTTNPIDEAWNSGQFITATIGAAYNKWARTVQEKVKTMGNAYQLMQPFTVVEFTSDFEGTLRDSMKTSVGPVLVSNSDSFSFATQALDLLGIIGCDLSTFQAPRITTLGFATPASRTELIPVVDVSLDGSTRGTRLQVAQWFAAAKQCALEKISPANGIVHFVRLISTECLTGGYAYLYKDASSVYNVTLAASPYRLFTTELRVGLQRRVILDLLSGFGPGDVVVYSLVLLALAGIILAFVSGKMRKRRRRVSFEGEVLAREAVIQNILMESDKARDQIIDYFYEEKRRGAWTFQHWFQELWHGDTGAGTEHVVRDRGRSDTSVDSALTATSAAKSTGPPSSLYQDPRYTMDGKVKALDRSQLKKVAARREKDERRMTEASGASGSRPTIPSEIGMTSMSSVTNPVLAGRESSHSVSNMSDRSKEPELRRSHKEAPAPEREVAAEKGEVGQRPAQRPDQGGDQGGDVSAKGEDKEDGDYIPHTGAAATAEAGEGAAEQGQGQGQGRDEEASS